MDTSLKTLEPRIQSLWRLSGYMGWMPAVAALGAAVGFLGIRVLGWDWSMMLILGGVGACLGGPFLATVLPPIMYRHWRFALGERELRLQHGVINRVDIWVPYSRIQYVELRQGLFERRLRLSSLVVHTAGSEGAQVVLPGLDPEEGERLRKTFLTLIEHEPS